MSKPVAFIMVEGGQTWLRTTAETEEAIRTGFINETIPLYKQREPLSELEIQDALIRCRQSTTWDYGFEAGVKYAEKMYGIGVGNE